MMELFCEYVLGLTIFTTKAPSWMSEWVINRPPKILNFPK